MKCTDCGGRRRIRRWSRNPVNKDVLRKQMRFRSNPLSNRLEHFLAHASRNTEAHEAANARRLALRELSKVTLEDLPELKELLKKLVSFDLTHPGTYNKISGIISQAALSNNVLSSHVEPPSPSSPPPSPPQPLSPEPPPPPPMSEEEKFESRLYGTMGRWIYEAQRKAAREFSWGKYRHPWVAWQAQRDEEDADDQTEWFAQEEQPSLHDIAYEESRRPPWHIWSRGVGPHELFQLISDLGDEEHRWGAITGLRELRWPPVSSLVEYINEHIDPNAFLPIIELAVNEPSLPLDPFAKLLISIIDTAELDMAFIWSCTELVAKKVEESSGRSSNCAYARLIHSLANRYSSVKRLRLLPGPVSPDISYSEPLEEIYEIYKKLIRLGGCDCEDSYCIQILVEDLESDLDSEDPSDPRRKFTLQVIIDLHSSGHEVSMSILDPEDIVTSEVWRQLQESFNDPEFLISHTRTWISPHRPGRPQRQIELLDRGLLAEKLHELHRIVRLTTRRWGDSRRVYDSDLDRGLPQALPLLQIGVQALRSAVNIESKLYMKYLMKDAIDEWQPKDREIQNIGIIIARIAANLGHLKEEGLDIIGQVFQLILLPKHATQQWHVYNQLGSAIGKIGHYAGIPIIDAMIARREVSYPAHRKGSARHNALFSIREKLLN